MKWLNSPLFTVWAVFCHTQKKCSSCSLEHLFPQVVWPQDEWVKGERKSLSIFLHLLDSSLLSESLKKLKSLVCPSHPSLPLPPLFVSLSASSPPCLSWYTNTLLSMHVPKRSFQHSRPTALRLGQMSYTATEGCRAVDCLRWQEANVVCQFMSLTFSIYVSAS